MAEVKFVQDIEGLGKLYVYSSNFHDQLKELKQAGAKYPISIRDAAYARLHDGPKDGTRTCAAPIWYKELPLVVAKISPLVKNLDMAKQAVEANRKNKYFSTDNSSLYEQCAEIAKKDEKKSPNKRRVIALPSNDNFRINKNDEISQFFFGNTVLEYFNKFAPDGITFYTPNRDYTQDKNGTGVSYLWFFSPDYDSVLYGYGRYLINVSLAFGVSRSRGHAEGVAKNLPYSKREIDRNLKILNQIKEGKIRISDLESKVEEVAEFLKSLKQ